MNFVVIYFGDIFAFSMMMVLQFAGLFLQYNSVDRAFHALIYCSFGYPDRAMQDLNPFLDRRSSAVVVNLFFFMIFVVTICLNFFTTIVLEAYTVAMDPSAGREQSNE